jgi:hypothetical protein
MTDTKGNALHRINADQNRNNICIRYSTNLVHVHLRWCRRRGCLSQLLRLTIKMDYALVAAYIRVAAICWSNRNMRGLIRPICRSIDVLCTMRSISPMVGHFHRRESPPCILPLPKCHAGFCKSSQILRSKVVPLHASTLAMCHATSSHG